MLKLIDLIWVTPSAKKRLISLVKNHQWVEVYNGELLLIHKSYLHEMKTLGFIEADEPIVYDSPEEAERAGGPYKVVRGQ